MNRFEGKTVIVTGGASGIGAATARRLYDEGANVVIVDVQEAAALKVSEEIGAPERVMGLAADVTEMEAFTNVLESCRSRFGVPDGLVNSAGIRGVGSILDTSPELFKRNLAVNLEGSFYSSQAFAKLLVSEKRPGAIVNVSSTAGIQGISNRLAYVTSKHGVIGLTKAAALDLAPHGIRVNVITPGMIRTPMTAPMFVDPENVVRIRASHPLGREGEPEEIAAAIAFALSGDAGFMTGAVIPIDGGTTVGQPSH